MQIILSFDYELFFGPQPGSVEKCIIEPTNRLLNIAEKYGIALVFFIDVGYLMKLTELKDSHPELQTDWDKIQAQLNRINESSSEMQLHIHPHWENARYQNGVWNMNLDNSYKLSDFAPKKATEIVRKYHAFLLQLSTNKITTYRAGGWCVQPFSLLEQVFTELGIQCDSSVFPGGKFESVHYAFDFTSVMPFTNPYRFQSDVCRAEETGFFLEVPISSWYFRPLFYWRLYFWGRLLPSQHKMLGDGIFVAQPGRKRNSLLHAMWNHVSCDGFYASKLQQQATFYRKHGCSHFVVIGHPKSMTLYSFRKLESFIAQMVQKDSFSTYNSCISF